MNTKKLNIIIETNADFIMSITLRDDNGQIISLAGATVEAQLRQFAEASDSIPFSVTHNGAGGRIRMAMVHEQTAEIGYSQGVYDIVVTFADETTAKVLEGDAIIVPGVTRPYEGQMIYMIAVSGELPAIGHPSRLYLQIEENKIYRWTGTEYEEITGGGGSGSTDWNDITNKPIAFPPSAHTHDYETDLTNKPILGDLADHDTVNYETEITNIPESFPPSTHNHDDRYYTESEIDTALTGKANTDHNHDGRYYTESETNTLLSGKANTDHNHDGRYYTESEVDTALAGKAATSHTHDDRYYTESEIDTALAGKSSTGHTHDDRYFTETEVTAALALKANVADLGDMATEDDAPSDDKKYGRKNGNWVEIQEGGGGTLEAEWGEIIGTLTDQEDLVDALNEKAPVIYNQASGSIASFSDGSASPVTALSVSIDPVQDLHGYDNPWPAGGGKNLLPLTIENLKAVNTIGTWNGNTYTQNGIDFTIEVDNAGNVTGIKAVGTATSRVNFLLWMNYAYLSDMGLSGTYTLSGCPSNGSTSTYALILQAEGSGNRSDTGSGNTFNTSDLSNQRYRFCIDIKNGTSCNLTFYPMLRLASVSDATFAPYSNICPISGHSTSVLTRMGNEIGNIEIGGFDENGLNKASNYRVRSVNYIPVSVGDVYSVFGKFKNGTLQYSVSFYDKNDYTSARLSLINWTNCGVDFTIPSGTQYMRILLRNAQDNYFSTETVEYAIVTKNIHTLTIDLDGTRYGAILDVLMGTMMVIDGNIASYNGETLPSTWISDRDVYAPGSTPTIGAQVVYKLASPQTVQLSPSQMQTLLGENHIFADTGDISITYRADTKRFIDEHTKRPYYVKGTQTVSTGSWTGNLPDIDALYEGLIIDYWLPYAGSGNATLNLTLGNGQTTGAINCYYQSTTRLTTHIPANNVCQLVYQTVTISGTSYTGWWLLRAYDANTTYSVASTTANGLMSKEDKAKLNGIAENANAYTLPTASASELGGVKVGNNLSISDGVLSATDTTYSPATSSANGLMSSTDKSKLDGIANNANNYSLPNASSNTLGGVKVGSNLSIDANGVLSATDTTYGNASSSTAGLMSSSDKSKLDGIASGANAYVLPAASSSALGGVKVEISTTDLEDGVSQLEAGKLYFYIESQS